MLQPTDADIALRLIAATVVGAAVGLNRDLHGKPTGVRTMGLVALAAALLVCLVPGGVGEASRVMQGIVTGVGFLGAGVILHDARAETGATRVRGLTTAASTWATAALGVAAGLGAWGPLLVAFGLMFTLLVIGGPIERRLRARWGQRDDA